MSVVVPFSQAPQQRAQQPEAQPTYLAIAAAQMHADDRLFPSMSLDETIRTQGSARFDPSAADDASKAYMNKLPDDIEKIDRGNTIELRLKRKAEDIPTS